ncbi:hypothetical protein BLNAU_4299 [Blattamonas nauphoetae]|uniref:Uncharacterized protein n=1 Tax=Blattamonas nauphoetae TaxID=2049346 RepID=A0ABQ9YAA0_9EUKA|nr:hypothetical protein BLNAU_4299 [Blattamonas nauphoetae]
MIVWPHSGRGPSTSEREADHNLDPVDKEPIHLSGRVLQVWWVLRAEDVVVWGSARPEMRNTAPIPIRRAVETGVVEMLAVEFPSGNCSINVTLIK